MLLKHTREDSDNGVRAYFPVLMEALRCHMDVSFSDGRGMLLRYVAGYVPKFSASFANDWLNDDATANSITRRILFDYHPLEPEMWLQMSGHMLPQCSQGGVIQRFIVPIPWMREMNERTLQYMTCP